MRIMQGRWTADDGWRWEGGTPPDGPQLVFVFGDRKLLEEHDEVSRIRTMFPDAHVVGASGSGEILGTRVFEDSLIATAVSTDVTRVKVESTHVDDPGDSFAAGARLARGLEPTGLVHAFVLSDGQHVNGSRLVEGLESVLPDNVAVTGGLAGDGDRFEKTLVFADDDPEENQVALVGFYGDRLRVGFGSLGGWDPFGPKRVVTKASGNILYELDGRPALDLYKTYLGDHADELPASGLLFPLSLQSDRGRRPVVRTILNVDEKEQSMVFAGDIPQGAYAQLMKANFERLVDGAFKAAQSSNVALGSAEPDLAILVSCVGRRLVLKQRTEQELDAVRDILGPRPAMAGFYSYGEICPAAPDADCELHNQTMTITTFLER